MPTSWIILRIIWIKIWFRNASWVTSILSRKMSTHADLWMVYNRESWGFFLHFMCACGGESYTELGIASPVNVSETLYSLINHVKEGWKMSFNRSWLPEKTGHLFFIITYIIQETEIFYRETQDIDNKEIQVFCLYFITSRSFVLRIFSLLLSTLNWWAASKHYNKFSNLSIFFFLFF